MSTRPRRNHSPAFKAKSVGASAWTTQASNHTPVIGPSMTSGAVMPASRKPPTNVVVFQ